MWHVLSEMCQCSVITTDRVHPVILISRPQSMTQPEPCSTPVLSLCFSNILPTPSTRLLLSFHLNPFFFFSIFLVISVSAHRLKSNSIFTHCPVIIFTISSISMSYFPVLPNSSSSSSLLLSLSDKDPVQFPLSL